MSKIEMGLRHLLNQSAKGDHRAIREVVQMKRSLGDVAPPQSSPIFQVNFVKAKHEQLKLAPLIDSGNPPEVDEDEEEWVEVEDPSSGEWIVLNRGWR
jgi:hypothetical protein